MRRTDSFSVPGGADFALGIADLEEPTEAFSSPVADALVGGGEDSA